MNYFDAKVTCKRVADLRYAHAAGLVLANEHGNARLFHGAQEHYEKALSGAIEVLTNTGIMDAVNELHRLLKKTRDDLTYPAMAADAATAESAILRELDKRKFLYVDPSLSGCVDQECLFGAAVYDKFKSAREDITAVGNCLAATCDTAAVFHSMRAVEWGLRALAHHLGVRRLKSIRKNGIVKLTPVAYAQWETILNGLPSRVEKRLKKLRPGRRKQELEQFYNECIQEINAIRQAWRNHIMHSRDSVHHDDAVAVVGHVKRLLIKLSMRVSEV